MKYVDGWKYVGGRSIDGGNVTENPPRKTRMMAGRTRSRAISVSSTSTAASGKEEEEGGPAAGRETRRSSDRLKKARSASASSNASQR